MTQSKTRPETSQEPPEGFPAAEELEMAAPRLPAVVDRLRLAALDRNGTLGAARERALAREEARRKARFGEDSPEVTAVAARLDVERRRQVQRREIVRLAEVGLELQPEEVVVLGRITHPDGRPAAGFTVRLTDERGPEEACAAETTTDDAGFYVLKTSREDFQELFEKARRLVVAVSGETLDGTHLETRPPGDPSRQIRRIDVQLPEEVREHAPRYPRSSPQRKEPRKSAKTRKRSQRSEEVVEESEVPVTDVRGIGSVLASRLKDRGITTAREVAVMSRAELATTLEVSQGRADKIRRNARRKVGGEEG